MEECLSNPIILRPSLMSWTSLHLHAPTMLCMLCLQYVQAANAGLDIPDQVHEGRERW